MSIIAEMIIKSRYKKTELAKKLFVTPMSLYCYMSGKRKTDISVLFDLCCICNYDFLEAAKELNLDINSHKPAFERFFYKLSDEKKESYLKNHPVKTTKTKNADYLDLEIKKLIFEDSKLVEVFGTLKETDPGISAKLDRIIELLERLVNE